MESVVKSIDSFVRERLPGFYQTPDRFERNINDQNASR
jgi:hypothetical protein